MYEWENEVSEDKLKLEIYRLQEEIKRITKTTLNGNFSNPEDREYWVKKVRQMNSKLSALEESVKPKRKNVK